MKSVVPYGISANNNKFWCTNTPTHIHRGILKHFVKRPFNQFKLSLRYWPKQMISPHPHRDECRCHPICSRSHRNVHRIKLISLLSVCFPLPLLLTLSPSLGIDVSFQPYLSCDYGQNPQSFGIYF